MRRGARHKLVLTVLAILPTIGCATAGKRFDSSRVGHIVDGETTKKQILAMFGEPGSYFNRGDKKVGETWVYSYVRNELFGFGLTNRARTLGITFDKNDVVKSHSYQKIK